MVGASQLLRGQVPPCLPPQLTPDIPYSGKFLHGANFRIFRMRILHAKIKTTKISTIEKIYVNFDLTTREYGQLELCQIFERSTQRLLISRTIETEAKKAHKPEARSPCCAAGHR